MQRPYSVNRIDPPGYMWELGVDTTVCRATGQVLYAPRFYSVVILDNFGKSTVVFFTFLRVNIEPVSRDV